MKRLLPILAVLPFVIVAALTPRRDEQALVRITAPKVVKISLAFQEGGKGHRFVGSGAFISPDGSILTCAHLFGRDGRIFVKTASGQVYFASIVRVDHVLDLAVIKIAVVQPVPYFALGPNLVVGQRVMALGSPLAIQGTASFGYVENISAENWRILQSAPINPGNSGGPLVDDQGRLVGVNVAILLVNPFQFAEGMGLAVSLDAIRSFVRV